ncbi:MAG: HAMP domain-containing sensor histidine kinase [Planctomycetota bacterium]
MPEPPQNQGGFSLSQLPPLSLRLRLTLWTVAIFVILQTSLALVFELYRTESINSMFNGHLHAHAMRIVRAIEDDKEPVSDLRLAAISAQEFGVSPSRAVVDLFSDAGVRVATSASPASEVPPGLSRRVRVARSVEFFSGSSDQFLGPDAQSSAARGVLVPVARTGDPLRVLAVVAADDVAHSMLEILTRFVLTSIAVGVVSSSIATYLIAGIAVHPINAVTRAVRRISPESIGDHVDVPIASSEMAELQDELELARQRIESGFVRQERFMSNVSHEIKTPIAVMLAEAQTIKLDKAAPEIRDFVKSVSEEALRLGRMVDSFLLLTRVRHGKKQIPGAESCLIREVLMDSFDSCRPMATQFGVRLDVRLPEASDVDTSLQGNCDLLRTVFDNLLRNAIRFSPRGGMVSLSAEIQRGHLHASIRDQGKGISPELLPRVFNRFAQAKEEEHRGRGHGLGLEIALGIAELHGGSIVVRNLPDAGAEFTVILPLATHQAPSLDCPARSVV